MGARILVMAKCLTIAVGAGAVAKKRAPNKDWKDKWEHGYVGCVLRQQRCCNRVTRTIAVAKELIDALDPLGTDPTPSKWDIEATMYGWKKGLWGTRIKLTWFGFRLVKKSPKEICDHFRDKWEDLRNEEVAAAEQ